MKNPLTTFATTGYPKGYVLDRRRMVLLPLGMFPETIRRHHGFYRASRLGALFPIQLTCAELVNPTYWSTRERNDIVTRALTNAGYVPTEIDFRKMVHNLIDYVEAAKDPLETILSTLRIPIEPMLLVMASEEDFFVVGANGGTSSE